MSTPLASCLYCEGWGCTCCKPPHVPGEQSPTAEDLEHGAVVDSLRRQLAEAHQTLSANAAAISRFIAERDLARRGLDTRAVDYIRRNAIAEEREACLRLADIPGHAVAQAIAAAIRARGGT